MKSETLGGHQCGVSLARTLTCPYTVPPSSRPEPAHDQEGPEPCADYHTDAERYSTGTQPMVDEPADESPERHTGDQIPQRGPPDVRRGPFVATSSRLLVTGHDARTISAGQKGWRTDPRGYSPAGVANVSGRAVRCGSQVTTVRALCESM